MKDIITFIAGSLLVIAGVSMIDQVGQICSFTWLVVIVVGLLLMSWAAVGVRR